MRERGQYGNIASGTGRRLLGWGFFDRPSGEFSTGVDIQAVARFERTPDGIVYEAYDLGSPQGNQIMASLEEGRRDRTTQLSKSNAEIATWWRFI
jgi:hypothetical protein